MSLYSRAETDAQSLKVLNTTEKNSVDKYDHDNTLIVDGDSVVAGAQGYATAARRTIFIDDTEATLSENKERGLTAPGWWEYMTYTDAEGNTRHKAKHLVAFKNAPANAADADDAVAADAANAITFTLNVADFTGAPDPTVNADFTVAVTVTNGGGAIYQWQKQTPTGTRWTNVTNGGVYSGATTNELLVNGADKATYDGYKFRVKVTSDNGAEEVISATGTLTFA